MSNPDTTAVTGQWMIRHVDHDDEYREVTTAEWVEPSEATIFSVAGMSETLLPEGGAWCRYEVPAQKLYDETVAKLKESYELIYVDRGDQLNDEQIDAAFRNDWGAVWESMDNWMGENQYQSALSEIGDLLSQEEQDFLSAGEYLDELRMEIYNRDKSNPFDELARGNSDVDMQFMLGYDVPPYLHLSEDEDRTVVEEGIAEALGIDVDEHRSTIRSIIEQASYGGRLVIMWRGDLLPTVNAIAKGAPVRMTWTDPYVLCHDLMNGSGWAETFEGVTITRDFFPADQRGLTHGRDSGVRLDKGSYSWDSICGGLYLRDTADPPTIEEIPLVDGMTVKVAIEDSNATVEGQISDLQVDEHGHTTFLVGNSEDRHGGHNIIDIIQPEGV